MEKFCLQCGAPLLLNSVPLNPDNAGSLSVAACSACGSQKYDTPNGVGVDRMKSQEALTKAGLSCEACEGYVFRGIELLTAQRDELLAALKEVAICFCFKDVKLEQVSKIVFDAINKYEHPHA